MRPVATTSSMRDMSSPDLAPSEALASAPSPASVRSLRVIVEQPSLAKYRIPVFKELAGRAGLDVTVFYSEAPNLPNVPADGFKSVFVPSRRFALGGRTMIWNSSCWQNARKGASDVLVLNWNLNHVNLVPAVLRARANGIGVVLWGHGFSKVDARWRRFSRHKVAQLADALVFYNYSIASRFYDEGWPKDRIHVALNTIDQNPIQAARREWLAEPARLHSFRAQHGLPEGKVILYVSRLKPERRLDLLLRATQKLRAKHKDAMVVIIGSGDAEQERLRALASQLELAEAVKFIGPLYEETELAPWFLNASVFCCPSNIGLSLMHAFGYGIPVVTCAEGGIQGPEIEAFEAGLNGLSYREGEWQSLADALDRLLTDRKLASELGRNGFVTATQRYSVARMVDGLEQAIGFASWSRMKA